MKKHFLLSVMAMLLPLVSWAQLTVKLSKAEIEYDGGKTTPQITVYSSGVELNPEDNLYEVTISPVEVRNVGEYKVTVKGSGILGGLGEVSETFKITPKPLTGVKLTSSLSREYGEENSTIDLLKYAQIDGLIDNSDVEKQNAIKCLTLEPAIADGKPNEEKVGGNYYVSVVGTDEASDCNYSYTPQASDTKTVYKVNITERSWSVELTKSNSIYGESVAIQDWTKDADYTLSGVLEGDKEGFSVTFASTPETVLNAGEYTITPTQSDNENYKKTADAVIYTVNQKTLVISAKVDGTFSKTYGEAEPNIREQFEVESFLDSENDETIDLKIQRKTGESVGDYPINITWDENKATNYTITAPDNVIFKIGKKTLTDDMVSIIGDEFQYQGQDYKLPAEMLSVKDGELLKETDYTYSTTGARDCGDAFVVTVTAQDNYTGTVTISDPDKYKINKKYPLNIGLIDDLDPEDANVIELSKEGEEGEPTTVYGLGKVYDGTYENIDLTEYFKIVYAGEDKDIFTLKNNSLRDNTSGLSLKDASAYYISLYDENGKVVPRAQYKSENITEGHKNYIIYYDIEGINYTILPKELKYWIGKDEKSYDGKPADLSKVKVEIDGFVGDESFDDPAPVLAIVNDEGETVETSTVKNAGTYNLAISNLEAVKNAMSNYELVLDEDKNEATYTINPAILQITVLDQTVKYPATEDDIVTTISGNVAWNNDPTDGKYVSIKVQDGTFRIVNDQNKILSVLGKNLKVSEDVDYLKVDEYENALTLSVSVADINKSLQNYEVNDESLKFGTIFVDGGSEIVLNVIAEETNAAAQEEATDGVEPKLEPTVSELLKAYNDTEVEKVIIKNLKNVRYESSMTAEKWHSLVLPFDIRVRDLSSALGYAIVNVPDETKNVPDYFYFKLTMGTVPANTYMLVKIDEGINWGEIEGDEEESEKVLEFNNVKINYNDEPTTDAATNKFVPVYELTSIYNRNQYVVDYTTGTWKYPNAERGFKVYPLNGYLEASASAQNIRIFVEDIDGTVTEISEVSSDAINANNAEGWYTINGVKLNAEPTEKGIYINNGKKVVIK